MNLAVGNRHTTNIFQVQSSIIFKRTKAQIFKTVFKDDGPGHLKVNKEK